MSVEWAIHDYVEIEHQVIRDGFNELLIITSVKSTEKLKWKTEEIPFEDLSDIPTGNKVERNISIDIAFSNKINFNDDKDEAKEG